MSISWAIAGSSRSLSRQRRRLGPMLPARDAEPGADLGIRQRGVVDEQGEQLLAARGQLLGRLAQRRVPFGREQVLLGWLGVIIGDGPGDQRVPACRSPFLARVTRPVTTASSRPRLACWVMGGFVAMAFSWSWSDGDLLARADDWGVTCAGARRSPGVGYRRWRRLPRGDGWRCACGAGA